MSKIEELRDLKEKKRILNKQMDETICIIKNYIYAFEQKRIRSKKIDEAINIVEECVHKLEQEKKSEREES